MKNRLQTIFFIFLFLVLAVLVWTIISPYLSYFIMAIVIGYTLRPLYNIILNHLKKPWAASTVMLVAVFLLLFIPFILFASNLVEEGINAISSFDTTLLDDATTYLSTSFNLDINFSTVVTDSLTGIKDFLLSEGLAYLSGFADVLFGLIIMFFLLYYIFKDGDVIAREVMNIIPLRDSHKKVLFTEVQLVSNAVIYGQLVAAMAQGFIGALGFVIFGIPNAVFWGFVMALLSIFPIIGAYLVFVPAGILQIMGGNYVAGFGIMIYGALLVSNIDNVIKTLIISDKSKLNPALTLLGVIGGLKAFGFIGFFLGPLILAMFSAVVRVYKEDFKPSAEQKRAKNSKKEKFLFTWSDDSS